MNDNNVISYLQRAFEDEYYALGHHTILTPNAGLKERVAWVRRFQVQDREAWVWRWSTDSSVYADIIIKWCEEHLEEIIPDTTTGFKRAIIVSVYDEAYRRAGGMGHDCEDDIDGWGDWRDIIKDCHNADFEELD